METARRGAPKSIDFGLNSTKKHPNEQRLPISLWEQTVDSTTSSFKDAISITAKLEFTFESTNYLRTEENGLNAQFAWFIYIVL